MNNIFSLHEFLILRKKRESETLREMEKVFNEIFRMKDDKFLSQNDRVRMSFA